MIQLEVFEIHFVHVVNSFLLAESPASARLGKQLLLAGKGPGLQNVSVTAMQIPHTIYFLLLPVPTGRAIDP